MSFSLALWLFLAITVFWAVGVYNRLMRLRARARDAIGSLDKHLGLQVELVCRRFGVAAEPDARAALLAVPGLPGNWITFLDAVANQDAALRRLRPQPLEPLAMLALGQAVDSLQLHWRALNSAPADLAGATVPEDMRLEWEELAEKSRSARGGVNRLLASYDEAIAQFPAQLLARFMGLTPAGQV